MEHLSEKVWEAIELHKTKGFDHMISEQIRLLPKNYIKTIHPWDLEKNWNSLPKEYQQDLELQQYKYCPGHKNNTQDFGDSPLPRRINCPDCIKNVG